MVVLDQMEPCLVPGPRQLKESKEARGKLPFLDHSVEFVAKVD